MKLTIKKLAQIIREEVAHVVREAEPGDFGTPKRRRYGTETGDPVGLLSDEEAKKAAKIGLNIGKKTSLGWRAAWYAGDQAAFDAALLDGTGLSDILNRLYNVEQTDTYRGASTRSQKIYLYRAQGREEGGLNIFDKDGERLPWRPNTSSTAV